MSEYTIDWLILNYASFFEDFGIDKQNIISGYTIWSKKEEHNSILEYLMDLMRQVFLLISKNSDSEEDFCNSNLRLILTMLELPVNWTKENRNYFLQQIHLDKLMISSLTLPFEFEVQINAKNCCSYCDKKDGSIYSYLKVIEKKLLPFARCKRSDDCTCSYSIVPLTDDTGKIILKS